MECSDKDASSFDMEKNQAKEKFVITIITAREITRKHGFIARMTWS